MHVIVAARNFGSHGGSAKSALLQATGYRAGLTALLLGHQTLFAQIFVSSAPLSGAMNTSP
jgi:hypothetical protein